MYNPVFFEMMSSSIVAHRVATAERQRTANTLASGRSTGWTGYRRLQSLLAHRLQILMRRPSGVSMRASFSR
jgi:hypothetical protein